MKKITGNQSEWHYILRGTVNYATGEIDPQKPEYTTMSRRPGIGKKWYEQFKNDVYPKDFVTIRGQRHKPPKYYDKLLETTHTDQYEKIKTAREKTAKERKKDNTPDRLLVRETCKTAQTKNLSRKLQ